VLNSIHPSYCWYSHKWKLSDWQTNMSIQQCTNIYTGTQSLNAFRLTSSILQKLQSFCPTCTWLKNLFIMQGRYRGTACIFLNYFWPIWRSLHEVFAEWYLANTESSQSYSCLTLETRGVTHNKEQWMEWILWNHANLEFAQININQTTNTKNVQNKIILRWVGVRRMRQDW
jgi:hypothetical protein